MGWLLDFHIATRVVLLLHVLSESEVASLGLGLLGVLLRVLGALSILTALVSIVWTVRLPMVVHRSRSDLLIRMSHSPRRLNLRVLRILMLI